jgi:hypothetical protein
VFPLVFFARVKAELTAGAKITPTMFTSANLSLVTLLSEDTIIERFSKATRLSEYRIPKDFTRNGVFTAFQFPRNRTKGFTDIQGLFDLLSLSESES